eukprot:5439915-Pleurochrysis_carterae.AAC.1
MIHLYCLPHNECARCRLAAFENKKDAQNKAPQNEYFLSHAPYTARRGKEYNKLSFRQASFARAGDQSEEPRL